jgi:hypothetical protein
MMSKKTRSAATKPRKAGELSAILRFKRAVVKTPDVKWVVKV